MAKLVKRWFPEQGDPGSNPSRRQGSFSPGVNDKNCVRLCWGCVLGKGTLPPFPTASDESIHRGLVCVARIPSNTGFKDPDAHVLDG